MARINLILSGGFGTRLWPLSHPNKPKQFLTLFKGKSLFQYTLQRNQNLVDDFFVVTNDKHWEIAKSQLKLELGAVKKFIEPSARNTAPAIAVSCMLCDPEDILFVTPSDHLINKEGYDKAVNRAFELAEEGKIVTIGIHPTFPSTGYGYLHFSGEDVLSFREKPEFADAQRYVESGNYYWNSGMFVFKAGVLLDALKQHSPEIFNALEKADLEQVTLDQYNAIPEVSIDYAVMEKVDNMAMVKGDFEWKDLGDFDALFDLWENHEEYRPANYQQLSGNSQAVSDTPVYGTFSTPTYVVNANGKTLVLEKGKGQEVKKIYKSIQAK
ncbi:MAG: mannose-1-phosphate guanyltransferase [Crocinitomicaceae bacterium]|nr:mannose-1-phosphate guanyltransferase [Crocinitomicaceae bacterium]|tara:strand:- start:13 stop:990 length:978 start_codon:yes stop_codon:yes gene_type:complete